MNVDASKELVLPIKNLSYQFLAHAPFIETSFFLIHDAIIDLQLLNQCYLQFLGLGEILVNQFNSQVK
jgi:hypothetical protein